MNRASTSKYFKDCQNHSQNQLQYYRRGTESEKLSILLVGSYEFCHTIQKCINIVNKETSGIRLSVSVAESIEHIVQSTVSLHIDFIIFLMNTAQRQSIEQVERDICLLEPVYLCDKTILVDGCNQLSPADRGVSYDELFNLTQKYHLHIFSGNIRDDNSRIHLVKRVLNLVPVVCGLKTGLPIALHFPTDRFPLY